MSLKGESITVWADGEILGGVVGAECKTESKSEEIHEFLTSKPVAVIPRGSVSRVVLRLHAPNSDRGFADFSPEVVELRYGETREIFSGCTLKSLGKVITPRGEAEYTAEIIAQTRSVVNE